MTLQGEACALQQPVANEGDKTFTWKQLHLLSLMVLYGVSIQVSPVKAEWKLWPLTVRQLNILLVPSTLLPDKSPVTVWGSNLEPCKDRAWGMTWLMTSWWLHPGCLPWCLHSACCLALPVVQPLIMFMLGNYLKQQLKTGFMLCVVLPVVPCWWGSITD